MEDPNMPELTQCYPHGHEMDPNWTRCLYCEMEEMVEKLSKEQIEILKEVMVWV